MQKGELPRGRLALKVVFKTDSRDLDWILLVLGQDMVRWRNVVEIVMTFDIHKRREFLDELGDQQILKKE
jgi:hypothetical protein